MRFGGSTRDSIVSRPSSGREDLIVSRELARVRDVYLEPFTRVATRKQIRVSYPLAMRLGWISRALSWALVVENLPPSGKRKERGTMPRSLRQFLDATASA